MLMITTLGSCRVANPVRRAVSTFPIILNNSRVYGYVHSAAEIVQQIRFLKEQFVVPQNLRPLIAPSVTPEVYENSKHRPSDVYIVEISSEKVVRIQGVCVQWNHFCRHFSAFLDEPERARNFWLLAKPGLMQEKDAFLAADSHFCQLPRADQDLLRGITLETNDINSLQHDVELILGHLPKTLFVTHVNAALDNGQPIPSRDRFIQKLKTVLANCGADFYDPTHLMEKFGQQAALKAEAGSLTHYTEKFESALFADWYNLHLSGCMQLAIAV